MTDFPFSDVDFEPKDVEQHEVIPHSQPATGRSLARRLALQALYELDTTLHSVDVIMSHFLSNDQESLSMEVVIEGEDSGIVQQQLSKLLAEDRTSENEETRIIEYFQRLVFNIAQGRKVMDELLQTYAPDFPIEQVAVVDRNILRIALFEMAVDTKIPLGVAIDEAIELSKMFGADSTARFVNGVLGAIAGNLRSVRESLHASLKERNRESRRLILEENDQRPLYLIDVDEEEDDTE
jgi:N utilization substance protein B